MANSYFVVVQLPNRVWIFGTPWTAAHQASLSLTISWSLPKFMSIESVMPSNHLILCLRLLLLPSIFPSNKVFSSESALAIRWPSASVLPKSIQGWFPLGLTGWSPCFPWNSQESSSSPQFKNVNSLVLRLLYGPTVTSAHDCWKGCSLDHLHLVKLTFFWWKHFKPFLFISFDD